MQGILGWITRVLLITGPRPSGLRPTARNGPAAQRPGDPRPMMARRPGPDFPPFFVQRLVHAHGQVCIEFRRAKWTTASLNSFTIIILNNHFDPFIRCMLLREKCFHSLFIRRFTKPEREEVHFQRCTLFSNHINHIKLSNEICELRIVTEFMIFSLSKYGLKITYIVR